MTRQRLRDDHSSLAARIRGSGRSRLRLAVVFAVAVAVLVGLAALLRPWPNVGPPAASQPRQIACDVQEAHLTSPIHRSKTDVVVEPIGWPGLKTWATADPRGFATGPSLTDFKLAAELTAGATVTVAVAPEARAYAGLDYGQASGYSQASAVTFHACPSSDTAFIGGFHVEGRRCVPFDVTPDGKPPVRVVISFFNGACGS